MKGSVQRHGRVAQRGYGDPKQSDRPPFEGRHGSKQQKSSGEVARMQMLIRDEESGSRHGQCQ